MESQEQGQESQPISIASEDTAAASIATSEQDTLTVVSESTGSEIDNHNRFNNNITSNGKHGSSTPTPSSIKKLKTESPRESSIDPEHANSFASVPDGPPIHEIVGGSSVRQYLNKHLTAHLLEGLRQIGADKPEDPLRVLGEYLIAKSDELKDQDQSS
ncbi:hypothetical protein DFJ63DRAFT_127058 [Scheffersomyces coipomensis]|uniref:uncharacterized protein n=1 Tax=Scheffersomyces coipomensis TaxID=1788519 RepID=UPI00315C7B48